MSKNQKSSVKRTPSLPPADPLPVLTKPLKVLETDSYAIVSSILKETVLKNIDYAIWVSENDRFVKPMQAK